MSKGTGEIFHKPRDRSVLALVSVGSAHESLKRARDYRGLPSSVGTAKLTLCDEKSFFDFYVVSRRSFRIAQGVGRRSAVQCLARSALPNSAWPHPLRVHSGEHPSVRLANR